MTTKKVALRICPYCRSDNIEINDHRPELDEQGDMVCQDYVCLACRGHWTVEYRPLHYFKYENDEFIETPFPLSEEV